MIKRIFYWLLLLAFFLAFASVSLAQEKVYTDTKSELNRLNQIINELEQSYNQASKNLQTSKSQLETQERQLQTLQEQLQTLKIQIEKSENLSIQLSEKLNQTEAGLMRLEESFNKYKKEAESKIKRLTMQRNIAVIVGIILSFI